MVDTVPKQSSNCSSGLQTSVLYSFTNNQYLDDSNIKDIEKVIFTALVDGEVNNLPGNSQTVVPSSSDLSSLISNKHLLLGNSIVDNNGDGSIVLTAEFNSNTDVTYPYSDYQAYYNKNSNYLKKFIKIYKIFIKL